MSNDPRLDELRIAWADDWRRMKAGTYVAPLPDKKRVAYQDSAGKWRSSARRPVVSEAGA